MFYFEIISVLDHHCVRHVRHERIELYNNQQHNHVAVHVWFIIARNTYTAGHINNVI